MRTGFQNYRIDSGAEKMTAANDDEPAIEPNGIQGAHELLATFVAGVRAFFREVAANKSTDDFTRAKLQICLHGLEEISERAPPSPPLSTSVTAETELNMLMNTLMEIQDDVRTNVIEQNQLGIYVAGPLYMGLEAVIASRTGGMLPIARNSTINASPGQKL